MTVRKSALHAERGSGLEAARSDRKLYAVFAGSGVVIGLLFPPVASFFVEWRPGMLVWFALTCIAAGISMAVIAAVSVRVTVIARLLEAERVEREKRRDLQDALHTYADFVEEVGRGRLTARLGDNAEAFGDEDVTQLGRQLDSMVTQLHSLSKQLTEAAGEMRTASGDMLATAAQQSTGAAEQATAVSEISTTVEEVRQTAEQAAERAKTVINTTETAKQSYLEGVRAVDTTIESITSLRDRVQSIATSILALSEHTQQIGEIVSTVSELAEQSNLLAINASIEAAKAGDQGRGFAVVAGEVRSLAEQSKQATHEVRSIIAVIQRATNSAVMVTEEGVKQAEAGMKLAHDTGETLRRLSKVIEESAQSARQIAAMSRQQALGIDQVSVAIRNIERASQDTVDGTRGTERSARRLAEISEALSQDLAARQEV